MTINIHCPCYIFSPGHLLSRAVATGINASAKFEAFLKSLRLTLGRWILEGLGVSGGLLS